MYFFATEGGKTAIKLATGAGGSAWTTIIMFIGTDWLTVLASAVAVSLLRLTLPRSQAFDTDGAERAGSQTTNTTRRRCRSSAALLAVPKGCVSSARRSSAASPCWTNRTRCVGPVSGQPYRPNTRPNHTRPTCQATNSGPSKTDIRFRIWGSLVLQSTIYWLMLWLPRCGAVAASLHTSSRARPLGACPNGHRPLRRRGADLCAAASRQDSASGSQEAPALESAAAIGAAVAATAVAAAAAIGAERARELEKMVPLLPPHVCPLPAFHVQDQHPLACGSHAWGLDHRRTSMRPGAADKALE